MRNVKNLYFLIAGMVLGASLVSPLISKAHKRGKNEGRLEATTKIVNGLHEFSGLMSIEATKFKPPLILPSLTLEPTKVNETTALYESVYLKYYHYANAFSIAAAFSSNQIYKLRIN